MIDDVNIELWRSRRTLAPGCRLAADTASASAATVTTTTTATVAAAAASTSTYGGRGVNACPAGYRRIVDLAECVAALGAKGKGSASSESTVTYPAGCYVYVSRAVAVSEQQLLLQSSGTDRQTSYHNSICHDDPGNLGADGSGDPSTACLLCYRIPTMTTTTTTATTTTTTTSSTTTTTTTAV